MENIVFDAAVCPMTRIMDLIGGKWKPIILYLIQHDVNRFGMLQKRMPRISRKVLTEHLRELEDDGLISRKIHTTKAPHVVTYALTDKGTSLRKLIDSMLTWGKENFEDVYTIAYRKVIND